MLEIKASGGIKNYEMANDMIKAGATRIGTSSGIKIINCSEDCNCVDEGGEN